MAALKIFAYYFGTCRDEGSGQLFGCLLLNTAITVLISMSLVCFIRAAECVMVDLSFSSQLQALPEDSYFRTNEEYLASLPCKLQANILKRVL